MRRAAIRAFRTASRYSPRRPAVGISRCDFLSIQGHALSLRFSSSSARPGLVRTPLKSSMYIRRFSVALVSTIVGYGAWYTYRGPAAGDSSTSLSSIANGNQQSRALTSSTIYSNPTQPSADGEALAEPTRKAVVVTADSIYTGAIEGDEPISKYTDDSGRKVLEMLTPEQATQKLRRNEESFFVGRGQGVVRYDVVQIPSNDPIEDDHSEKIVEVPQGLATATPERNASSDWMFWGVYDGHRYCLPAFLGVLKLISMKWLDNISKATAGPH
jgi:pyruvate dehydrogenase phosphatase